MPSFDHYARRGAQRPQDDSFLVHYPSLSRGDLDRLKVRSAPAAAAPLSWTHWPYVSDLSAAYAADTEVPKPAYWLPALAGGALLLGTLLHVAGVLS
jgi:hypothetical protein